MRLMRKFSTTPSNRRHEISEQIFNHLTRLFSSRASYSSFNRHFGLNDFSGETMSEPLIEQIKEDIKRAVLCWESRFLLEEVEFLIQENKPQFRLHGFVDDQHCTFDFDLSSSTK